jgi:hypothetical protein
VSKINKSYVLNICTDKNLWDDFVATSPQGNLFCQTKFLDLFQKNYELLSVCKGDEILLGAVVVKDEDNQPVLHPFMYQGVLFARSMVTLAPHKRVKKALELVDFLLAEVEKRYQRICFSLHPSFIDLRSFQWHNYHSPEKGQFKIDLNYTGILSLEKVENLEQIFMESRTLRRRNYNKSLKEGFTIEESDDIKVLDVLHSQTFERQGIGRSSGEKFMATTLAKKAISLGFGRLMICRDSSGSPASASLFLFDDKTAYYLIGANDPKFRKYGTGSYVMFEQIKRCLEHGLSQVDFVGINSPMRGDFKTSFGAVPVPYHTVCWNHLKLNN